MSITDPLSNRLRCCQLKPCLACRASTAQQEPTRPGISAYPTWTCTRMAVCSTRSGRPALQYSSAHHPQSAKLAPMLDSRSYAQVASEEEEEEEESLRLFPSQLRADKMPGPPTGGPADVYTLPKHASENRATPMTSSCPMKGITASDCLILCSCQSHHGLPVML